MSYPIMVIHAKDTEAFAVYLLVVLNQFGYATVTLNHVTEGMTPAKIRSNWPSFLNKSPYCVVIYSEQLLQDKFIAKAIYSIQVQRKAIFVSTDPNTPLPKHFSQDRINIYPDKNNYYRGINKLIHRLNRSFAIWPAFPHEVAEMEVKAKLRIN